MEKVLLINDSKFEAMVICDMLDNLGYEVKSSTEFDALLQIKVFQPSIVIANLIMKTIQGDDLIQKIKSYDSEIKCILSSNNDILLGDFLKKNVDAVLHTPTTKSKIEQVFESLSKLERLNTIGNPKQEEKKEPKEKAVNAEVRKRKPIILDDIKIETPAIVEKKKIAFCPFCGTKFENAQLNYVFCPSCGEKL